MLWWPPGARPGRGEEGMTQQTDVAIIGAGPYGLSVSAFLSESRVEHRIFGKPMQTWLGMPKTMSLKSPDFATNIYTPRNGFRMVEHYRSQGISTREPLLIERFASYGLWAQQQLVPQLEQQEVTALRQHGEGYELELAGGERLGARRVVVAVGVTHLARMPGVLAGLPAGLASHTSHHRDYQDLSGKDVAVLGAGQSALEAGVLLHEAGARPLLLVRGGAPVIYDPPLEHPPLYQRLRNPMSVMGQSGFGYFLEKVPFAVHYLPEDRRVRLTRTFLGPTGAWWLAPRFDGNVPVLSKTEVIKAEPRGSRLALRLRGRSGETERELRVDHVVAGTGYDPDLDRLPFLDPTLRSRLQRVERSPSLSASFESSLPGLYFVGLLSAFSFGPMYRFVCGAEAAAPRVARRLGCGRKRTTAPILGRAPRT
jgi:cation diffusion facilitator CzcD-associated flavoprotein CzcO